MTCEYTESKKRGPRKGYVQLLEERLSQLERLLTKEGREVPPPIAVESPTYSTSSFESKGKRKRVLYINSLTRLYDNQRNKSLFQIKTMTFLHQKS